MVYLAAFHCPSGESETRALDLYNDILPFQGPTRALHDRHCPQALSRIQLRFPRGFCLPVVFIIRFIIIRSLHVACSMVVFTRFLLLSFVSILLFLCYFVVVIIILVNIVNIIIITTRVMSINVTAIISS